MITKFLVNRAMLSGRIIVIIFFITLSHDLSGRVSQQDKSFILIDLNDSVFQDTLREKQVLYNGRIWRNLYYSVEGDQFLFSDSFLPAKLTIRSKEFPDITLKYDIYKDEILIPLNTGRILQLNKEMVDSFTLVWQNRKFHFTKLAIDNLTGYVNVLYNGKSALYVRYSKRIEKLAEQGKYDKFYQTSETYFERDGIIHPISGKRDLKNILKADKALINSFIRKNKLNLSIKNPESYIPLIRYLDNIR